VLKDEKLSERALTLGKVFRDRLKALNMPWVKNVRGKGLLNAVEIDPNHKFTALKICLELAQKGLLAKPTHGHIIRFAPPLVISETDLIKGCAIIIETFRQHDG
jgi:ornithine--oxo-acid transaminase